MNAGRELDALVAEKVMGWKHDRDAEFRHLCDGKFHTKCWACGSLGHGNCYGNGSGAIQIPCDCTPYYSTDIAAAWQVVEEMMKRGEYLVIKAFPNTGFEVELGGNADAGTLPLAICLAALKSDWKLWGRA